MKISTIKSLIAAASTSLMILSGCSTTTMAGSDSAASCGSLDARQLSQAVSQVKQSLSNASCHSQHGRYFSELLVIAKQDNPGPHNEAVFADFITWSEQQGILSTRQSRQLYVSYFRPTFASTPTQYSVCSSVTSGAALTGNMQLELQQKQEGLMEVLSDQAGYAGAQRVMRDMSTTYDALSDLCG